MGNLATDKIGSKNIIQTEKEAVGTIFSPTIVDTDICPGVLLEKKPESGAGGGLPIY